MTKVNFIPANGISFRQNTANNYEKTTENKDKQHKGLSDTQKGLIGLGAVAAIAIACIAAKKYNKAGNAIKEGSEKVVKKGTDSIQKGAEEISQKSKAVRQEGAEQASKNTSATSHIADDAVKPYESAEVIAKIKAIKGSSEENTNSIKNIFMEEMGYKPELINAKISELPSANLLNPNTMGGGFNYMTGEFMLNKEVVSTMSKEQLTGIIRHELDHFDKAAKLCKSIGIDEYEKLFTGIDEKALVNIDGTKASFNRNFWEQAIKDVDAKGFETKTYLEALKTQLSQSTQQELGIYETYLGKSNYINNPFEVSAHNIQHSVEKSLETKGVMQTFEYLRPLFKGADEQLNTLIKTHPSLGDNKTVIFDYLYNKAVIESDTKLNSLFKEISTSGAPNTATVEEFQKLMVEKMTSLQGSMFSAPDIAYEKKVFEGITNLAKKELSQQEMIEAFALKSQMHTEQFNLFNIDKTEAIKASLGKNNEKFLAYLDTNKIDNPALRLDILLKKVHCENNISGMFPSKLETLNITDDIQSRFFQNPQFKAILEANNLDATPENNKRLLEKILQETTFSIF
ncbi:MAG: hypothetical protein WCF95_02595 [bacterium]